MCRYKSEGDPKGLSDCDSLRRENEMNHDLIRQLREEIRALREERRWVPVGERLPELNEANHFQFTCLVRCGKRRVCEMTYEINTCAKQERHRQPRWKWHGMIAMWDITHWQEMPPGPEGVS